MQCFISLALRFVLASRLLVFTKSRLTFNGIFPLRLMFRQFKSSNNVKEVLQSQFHRSIESDKDKHITIFTLATFTQGKSQRHKHYNSFTNYRKQIIRSLLYQSLTYLKPVNLLLDIDFLMEQQTVATWEAKFCKLAFTSS